MNASGPITPSTVSALEERFEEALQLAAKGHSDRAIRLLVELVAAEPGNLDFVETLLSHVARVERASDNGQPPPADPPAELRQAVDHCDWQLVLNLGPAYLAASPDHAPTLSAMAEAAAAQGCYGVERLYLAKLLEKSPEDQGALRRLAKSLARTQNFSEALARWQQIESLSPGDAEAAQAIARLTIESSRQQLGLSTISPLEPDRSRRRSSSSLTNRAAAAAPARVIAAGGSDLRRTPIQELEIAIREFPSNADYYLQLVPLYLEKGREYDAERLLDKGREATAGDPRVCQLWEDVTMQRLQKRLAVAEKHLQSEDTTEARAELAEIRSERDQLETSIFISRCKREPHNAALRIQLALRLKRAGKIHDACQRLEEALSDPDHKSAAALELGRCYEQLKEPEEALRHYRLASDSATHAAHLDSKKQALYAAGQLAARLNLRRLAHRYLGDLLQLDPGYKDAAAISAKLAANAG